MDAMSRARSPRTKKLAAAKKPDSLAQTRAAPVFDELAQTREGYDVLLLALLDAGEALIAERGLERTTAEGIAQRAGVSTDAFYAHFKDMDALLVALNARFVEHMIAAVDEATRAGSGRGSYVADVVEIAVRSILDVVEERRGLVRALLARGASDGALATGLRSMGKHMTSKLVATTAGCADASEIAPTPRTIGFSLLLSVALAHHMVLVGDGPTGVGLTRDELAGELATALCAYLGASRPE